MNRRARRKVAHFVETAMFGVSRLLSSYRDHISYGLERWVGGIPLFYAFFTRYDLIETPWAKLWRKFSTTN